MNAEPSYNETMALEILRKIGSDDPGGYITIGDTDLVVDCSKIRLTATEAAWLRTFWGFWHRNTSDHMP